MSYVELHARSAFSFLRGASLPEQLAEAAGHLDLPAMALCDRDGVYGAPRFFGKAKEAGIRSIVGAELTMEDGSVLPVLVESRRGYQNLCRLLTEAHLRAAKNKSAVRWEELPQFSEGLVALTGDEEGPLVREILQIEKQSSRISNIVELPGINSNSTRSSKALEKLIQAFGKQNVFVEIQRHLIRGEERINNALVQFSEKYKLPLLATNGVLHATPVGRQVLDVFTCVRNHTHLDVAGKLLAQNSERFVKNESSMRELFRDLPEAIENTSRLAERLTFSLENLGYEFPRFPVPSGHNADSYLREQAFAGARKRYAGEVPEKVRGQIEKELALINKLGVAGYFLIVWDIVQFCEEQKIMAQGRGSAANSSVCYCLGITNVDPLKFHTLFERFLSEGRKNSWPDIDIDLPSGERREKVIQEVYKRYGQHGAAMTANVICYRGRSAAREIGKALNIPVDVLDRFSNLFANGDFPHTLDFTEQIKKAGVAATHPRAKAFTTLYLQLAEQHLPRHLGQHSGGMIVCQDQLSSVVPLENASMPNRVVAQWDKDDCEDLGIIKIDFLGLGMMSVIQDAVELTKKTDAPIDVANLPPDDPKTFEMIRAADTVGVFQIESRAQMATLPRMKPVNFYDLCIEVAIIRPGPIQGNLTHPYLLRRAGKQEVVYYHEDLKPILERTMGVPLFQEQMLEMAMVMTDFTASEAEELRRALSFHRSEDKMRKVEKKLRDALQKKGYKPNVIDEVAGAVTSFALYGFPESHAISFAHLAYSTAYLKAHCAPEFYASLLNNQPMGFYSSATLIKDGKRHGVKFRPACIEKSEWACTIEKDKSIRLGLCVVRGLNAGRTKEMLAQRERLSFSSIEDFKCRTHFNKEELRTLAEIGALNSLAKHRRDAMWEIEKEIPEDDLFSSVSRILRSGVGEEKISSAESPLQPMTLPERLRADYAGMQLTTGPHPMALFREKYKAQNLWRACDLPKAKNGETVCIAGNVICRQRPGTAKGFVFVTLEDETGMSNAIVAPKLFERLRLLITSESFLMITGKLQNSENVIHIRAAKIERLPHENLVGSSSYDFH